MFNKRKYNKKDHNYWNNLKNPLSVGAVGLLSGIAGYKYAKPSRLLKNIAKTTLLYDYTKKVSRVNKTIKDINDTLEYDITITPKRLEKLKLRKIELLQTRDNLIKTYKSYKDELINTPNAKWNNLFQSMKNNNDLVDNIRPAKFKLDFRGGRKIKSRGIYTIEDTPSIDKIGKTRSAGVKSKFINKENEQLTGNDLYTLLKRRQLLAGLGSGIVGSNIASSYLYLKPDKNNKIN